MRFQFLVCLASAASLFGCAYEGVIVQKESNELPLYHSLGVDGSYRFSLRDSAGVLHRQIVTPEVFARYEIGDHFNDLQPGGMRSDTMSDSKVVKTAMKTPAAASRTARIARVRKASSSRHLIAKSGKSQKATHSRKALAKRTAPAARLLKPEVKIAAPPAPASWDTDIAFVNVVRCR